MCLSAPTVLPSRMAVVVVLWCVFAMMLYKALTLERDYVEYDPYAILELDAVSCIPYSRVVKRTSLISAYSLLGVGLILLSKYIFIKRTFINIVPSNDTFESKRKFLFQLILDNDRTYFK